MSGKEGASNYYVDGDRMAELATIARDTGEFSDELIQMFYDLASRRWDLQRDRSMEKDDALQEAVLACYSATAAYRGGSAYSYYLRVTQGRWSELRRNSRRQKARPDLPLLSLDSDCTSEVEETPYGDLISPEDCIDYSHYGEGPA